MSAIIPYATGSPVASSTGARMNLENLPSALKKNGRYCYWMRGSRPGSDKPAKLPISPKTRKSLDVTDYGAFGTFDEVLDYQERGYDGVGVSISGEVCAIDIDNCRAPDGTLSDMAMDIVKMMQTYTEISPSGRGLRFFFRAPGFQYDKVKYLINNHRLGLEIYVAGATEKYVSVTGDPLFPNAEMEERGAELQTLLDKYMVRSGQAAPTVSAPPQGLPPALDDETVIRVASRGKHGETFKALMAGDTSGYDGDHSRADQALCSQLAFYTGNNVEQIDRLVRRSGLMRPKWDEQRGSTTYGELTIQQAVATQQTVYQPPAPPVPPAAMPGSQPIAQLPTQQTAYQPPVPPVPPVATPGSQPVAQVPTQQTAYQPPALPVPPVATPGLQPVAQAPTLPPVPQVVAVNASVAGSIPAAAMSGDGLISALELQQLNLPPTVYLVDGLLPTGTIILSAAPKKGKSWMAMDLGLCLATGKPFWGHKTTQCGVLYLALEDSPKRLQSRLNELMEGQLAPSNFYFRNEINALDEDVGEPLLLQLECFVANHPDIRLIIIDTFQKIRGTARPKETLYAYDYREMGLIKNFADKHELSILLVHHNRKMGDESDSFNMISGTNGILGAADTSWVLTSDKRSDTCSTLSITGRDVEQAELIIEFNKETSKWELAGSPDKAAEQQARTFYEYNSLVKAVKRLLNESPQHRWSGQAKDLLDAMDDTAGWNPQKVGYSLRRLKDEFYKFDGIIYTPKDVNGTGGKLHEFAVLASVMSDQVEQQ